MASTNFLQWNPSTTNQETDPEYLADSQRTGGAVNNTPFLAPLGNKAFYQWSTFCAAFGQMMANKGYSTSDASVSALAAVLAPRPAVVVRPVRLPVPAVLRLGRHLPGLVALWR